MVRGPSLVHSAGFISCTTIPSRPSPSPRPANASESGSGSSHRDQLGTCDMLASSLNLKRVRWQQTMEVDERGLEAMASCDWWAVHARNLDGVV